MTGSCTQEKILEEDAVTIRRAHRDIVLYPLAEIELEVVGVPISVEVAVSEALPWWMSHCESTLQTVDCKKSKGGIDERCHGGSACAQARQQHDEEMARQERELVSETQPNPQEEELGVEKRDQYPQK